MLSVPKGRHPNSGKEAVLGWAYIPPLSVISPITSLSRPIPNDKQPVVPNLPDRVKHRYGHTAYLITDPPPHSLSHSLFRPDGDSYNQSLVLAITRFLSLSEEPTTDTFC